MRTRRLNETENWLVNKWRGQLGLALVNRANRSVFTEAQIQKAYDLENAERAKKRKANAERLSKIASEEGEYYCSEEFRAEVIAEIIKSGATEMQAQGRTRDQARLFAEARELGLM